MGQQFHDQFLRWGRDGNYTTSNYTASRFGSELQKLINEITTADPSQSALKKTRHAGGWRYTVHWRKLRDLNVSTQRLALNVTVYIAPVTAPVCFECGMRSTRLL